VKGSTHGAATNAHPTRARGQPTDPAQRAPDHALLLWHRSVTVSLQPNTE